MRTKFLVPALVLAVSLLLPLRSGRAAREEPATTRPLPANCRWLMVEADEMMHSAGGGERVVALCERAKRSGYNGLLLWDSNLWNRDIPECYAANAAALKAGLARLQFSLMLEMCPRGGSLLRWSGDESICEPRPSHPDPMERDYRYLCLAHPGVLPIWETQVTRAERIYHPLGWLLQYDEIRVAGTDARCKTSGKGSGELLAEHARAAIAMCRRVSPGSIVAVWNDMFDPHHNALKKPYFHCPGGFAGAWNGIDKDVLILDFNDQVESFDYWAKRGNKQMISGYFDGELGLQKESQLIRQARQHPGVVGWCYTTWDGNFKDLESYGTMCGFGGGSPTGGRLNVSGF